MISLYLDKEVEYLEAAAKEKNPAYLQYTYALKNSENLKKALADTSTVSNEGKLRSRVFDWGSLWTIVSSLFRLTMFALLPAYLLVGLLKHLKEGGSVMNMTGKFEIKKAQNIEQRLADVKGIDEIKDEVLNIIKIIKDPQRYHDKGAKLFKGVMLLGEPGTGKTLLARAIAGEAGCNFIYCTGSDFDEMFVGVGARRIKQLFAEARKHQPCILFIDEVDSLLSGSRRGNFESSSSRATLNQILAEMDGFESNENIMVIGATNHEQALDPAAVRPGRFDKKIHVPHPDVNGRKDIFELYLSKICKNDSI